MTGQSLNMTTSGSVIVVSSTHRSTAGGVGGVVQERGRSAYTWHMAFMRMPPGDDFYVAT